MRVFVAGGTGVIGRRLVPQLVARGHQVTATTTSAGKLGLLEQLGAEGVVMDGLDAVVGGRGRGRGPAGRDREPDDGPVRGARRQAQPEEGRPLLRHHQPAPQRGDRPPAGRGRGDRCLPRRRAGPRQHERNPQGRMGQDRGGPAGGDRGDEGDQPPRGRGRQGWRRGPALRRVLRAGRQRRSGPARAEAAAPARRAVAPATSRGCIVDDAASATVLAVEQKAKGVFNIVDDEPAPVSEWLPYPRGVRRGQAAAAGPRVAGPAAGRRDGGGR